MTDLRTAAQQALEACEQRLPLVGQAAIIDELNNLRAALAQQADPTDPGNDVDALREHVRHLERRIRELHAQQAEPDHETRAELAEQQVVQLVEERDHYRNLWQKAQQAEPLNLSDRAVQRRLAAQWGYVPAAAQAEPVEPVAWECKAGGLKPLTQRQYDAQTAATKRHYTRIAPPQHEALQNTKHYEAPPGFVLNPDYLVPELRAQRDALLEALKVAEPYLRHADVDYNVYVQCRAAIALVEGRVKAVEEGK